MEDIFKDTAIGQLALAKLYPVAPGFVLYSAGWMGKNCDSGLMEVTGAQFRESKRGPRKGQVCILVKGTERTTYVTADELEAFGAYRAA